MMKHVQLTCFTLISLLFAPAAWAQGGSQFSLATSSLLESPAAGSDAVFVYASGFTGTESWVVPVSADWISVVPNDPNSASGISFSNGANQLMFRFTANSGPTRSTAITIGAATLTVTQAGVSFIPAGLVPLVSSGLNTPTGIAVDSQGNLWIADTPARQIVEWSASTQQLTPTAINAHPIDLAIDAAGDIYVLGYEDYGYGSYSTSLFQQPANSQGFNLLGGNNTFKAVGICVDAAGQNVYFADRLNTTGCAIDPVGNFYMTDIYSNTIGRGFPWTSGGATRLTSYIATTKPDGSILYAPPTMPSGLSLDSGGYLYFLDNSGTVLHRLDPSTVTKQTASSLPLQTPAQMTTLATGLNTALYSAVDTAGNIYLSETNPAAIQELPRAYISSGMFAEPAGGGDSIQILPASQSLTGVYAPVSSDTSWLTVGTPQNGVIPFSFAPNPGGQRSATITVLGAAITVTQWPTQVVSGMSILAGNNQAAAVNGQPFATNLQVVVVNAYGNAVPGVQVIFNSNDGNVGFSGYDLRAYGSVFTNANGLAAITAFPFVTGPLTVTATVAGTTISQLFSLTGVTNGLVALTGGGQGVLLNQTFPASLKVALYGSDGQPLSGVPIVFSVPNSGASGSFGGGSTTATVQTANDGTATAPALTANTTAGNFTAQASYAGASSSAIGSVNFGLTNYTSIYPLSGDGQSTSLNAAFPNSLTVEVLDQNAHPTQNVPVTFTVITGGNGAAGTFSGAGTSVVLNTGSNGTASAPVLTANGTAGTFTVVASAANLPSHTFTLTNLLATFNYGANQSGVTTRTLPQPFSVQATPGAAAGTIVFTVVPNADNGAGGTFNGAASATVNTDAQGYGTSPQLRANNTPGMFSVTAYDGVTTAVTNVTTTACMNQGNTSVVVSDTSDFNPAFLYGGSGLSAIDTGNLRYAVNNACAGSTIDLTQLTGTIQLFNQVSNQFNSGRLRIDDDLTIVGPGAGSLAIDGGNAPSPGHGTRLFFIGGGTVSISDLTLQNGLGQGGGSDSGGGAAGMGGAIFMNGGNVTLSNVIFSGNEALGGSAGVVLPVPGGQATLLGALGGGGFGANGSVPNNNLGLPGPGGGGGDLFGLGGIAASAAGDSGGGGSAGFNGGNGGFGGGGGKGQFTSYPVSTPGNSGNGGFGGGGGGGFAPNPNYVSVHPGNGGFGGGTGFLGNNNTNAPGGSGAGFGGAIFEYAGTLTLNNAQFMNNSAVGGILTVNNGSATAANQGQGKGGALFIYNGATAINQNSIFGVGTSSANVAANAGAPGIGSSAAPYVNGATCPGQDSANVCGQLLEPPNVNIFGPAVAAYASTFSVTPISNSGATPTIAVTAGPCSVNGTNITMTAGVGTCQLLARLRLQPPMLQPAPPSACPLSLFWWRQASPSPTKYSMALRWPRSLAVRSTTFCLQMPATSFVAPPARLSFRRRGR